MQHEEDLDDLDALLPQFTKPTQDFPDPDEPELGPSTTTLPPKPNLNSKAAADDDNDAEGGDPDLEATMAQLLSGLSTEDASDFQQMMQEVLKGGLPGMPGLGAGGEGEMDDELIKLLSGGVAGTATSPTGTGAGAGGKGKGKGKAAKSASTSGTTVGTEQVDFQSTISSTVSKLRSTASSASAASSAAAAEESDPLAALMAKMGGIPGAGEGEEGMQKMLDEMMEQLMSRELLYEPLKELSEKYPEYLASKGPSLPKADLAKFKLQQTIVTQIVAAFEEPGAEDPEGGDAETRKERSKRVIDLVAKMNECGSPPQEIMGDMPEGMQVGADGVPKLPEECTIS